MSREEGADTPPGRASAFRLVAWSFVMLFTELALIRWAGANILYLSYFSNFVLLGSFLGIGIGFLRARSSFDLSRTAPFWLAAFVAFVLLFPVEIDRSSTDVLYFGSYGASGLPAWLTLTAVFVSVAVTMASIAEGVARTFARFEPLEAYRLDIIGSVAGVVAFSALSFVGAPPVWWFSIVAVFLFALDLPRRSLPRAFLLASVVVVMVIDTLTSGTTWSPYYEIRLTRETADVAVVSVNGVPHQAIEPLTLRRELEPAYFLPYRRLPVSPDDVLIIGAGTGSDVAIALEKGSRRVDAVEIDPRLVDLGRRWHPDRPYDDPRVTVTIDDGRAYLERTDREYDLILFALPDSLTLLAGQSSIRLESYLFTTEAIAAARDHLRPGGAFAMYNYYREAWLIDRFANTLAEVFGHPPCVDGVDAQGRFAVLMTGRDPDTVSCRETWSPPAAGAVAPATDDHPFPYLRSRGIPAFYATTLGLIVAVSIAIVRIAGGPLRRIGRYADLFVMGVAFLLLETRAVVQFALLFGTTWFVNALVFAGVLIAVLAAVEIARRSVLPRPSTLYAVLLATIVIGWAVPPEVLLRSNLPVRFAAAVATTFGPILVANIVFAERFRQTSASTVAFGANLLGAMIGGVLEYASLVVGYEALSLVVAALYTLAFFLHPRKAGREATAEHRLTASFP